MAHLAATLQHVWMKNWPEVRAFARGGFPSFVYERHPSELDSGIPAFYYHVVDPETFEADLSFLVENHYQTVTADEVLDHVTEQTSAPKRAVVLTIDDGPRNLYEIAFPLLREYGLKAVAFVAPNLHAEAADDPPDGAPVSWEQLQEMDRSGVIDVQSHTYEHRYVPRWPETAALEGSASDVVAPRRGPALDIEDDFRCAREALEHRLGKTIRHLAFPRFDGNEGGLKAGRRAGYEAFWWGPLPGRPTCRPGRSTLHLPRIDGLFLRRLPGAGRIPLGEILRGRYGGALGRFLRTLERRDTKI